MKVLELSKNYIKKFYNNNFDKAIEALDGVLYDDERIKHAFNFGHGSDSDLIEHIKWNRPYCKYYDLINQKYI